MYTRILFILYTLIFSITSITAQEVKLVAPVVDNTQTMSGGKVLIVVNSNSGNLSMTHIMGDEVGVKEKNPDGTFRYTITYSFPDYYKDNFMKTQLILRLDAGQQTVPLTMHKGKVYVGSYNEMLKLNIKKDRDAVYPYEKSAKIIFRSALSNLSISCNSRLCFDNGTPVNINNSNVQVAVNSLEGQKEYTLIFSLDPAKSGGVYFEKDLCFEITAPGFSKAQVVLPVLNSRTSYNFMVVSNVKIIEKEVTYDELLKIAENFECEYTSQSSSEFFAAAADAYEAAREHKNCPIDKKDELQLKANKFKKIRNYTNRIQQAESRWRSIKEKEGFESQNVWKYLNFECKQFKALLSEFPEMSSCLSLVQKEAESQYKRHPLSSITYPVIQGSVVEGEGWFLPVDGTQIFLLPHLANSLKDVKKEKPVGYVRNGHFKILWKNKANKYLYFAGEKDSHYINEYRDQTINIELKR